MENDILTPQAFQDLMDWINGKAPSEPEGAGTFVSKLNELYITRRLSENQEAGTPRSQGTGSRLSLKNIVAESALNKLREGTNTIKALDTVDNMAATHTEARPQDDLPADTPADTPDERQKAQELPRSADGFIETGIDSVNIAAAITCWWAGMDKTLTRNHKWSVSLVMLAMYISYGVCLAKRMTRMTAEHPQMWRYGISFARAYNKLQTWENDGPACAAHFESVYPEIAGIIKDVLVRIAENGITRTASKHYSKGTPWGRTNDANPEKWGTPIGDTAISAWFTANINKNNLF